MRHSRFAATPSGLPSSNQARWYQAPSQLADSTRAPSAAASCSQAVAKAASARARASGAKRFSTPIRKNASQTLSPLPPAPTRFMPSFQSPPPISGRPCAPVPTPLRMARTQCSYRLALSAATFGSS